MPPSRGRPNASRPRSECALSSWSGTKPSATTTSGARPRSYADRTQAAICVERGLLLGDQDRVRARGHAGLQRDPADVPSHHLGDHAAGVRLAGGAQAVHGLGRDLHRGVEAERVVRRAEVVVDGLRHADDLQPGVGQALGRRQGALAADRDDGVDPVALEDALDVLDAAVLALERVRPAGAEDRAALLGDALDVLAAERDDVALDDTAPAVPEPDELVPVDRDALEDRSPDDRVESGAVAAGGEDADAHGELRCRVGGTGPILADGGFAYHPCHAAGPSRRRVRRGRACSTRCTAQEAPWTWRRRSGPCSAAPATRPSAWSGPTCGSRSGRRRARRPWRSARPATRSRSRRGATAPRGRCSTGPTWSAAGTTGPSSTSRRTRFLADARHRQPGLRLCRTNTVVAMLVPAIMEQKVTSRQAWGAWRYLLRRHGTPAPGPAPAGMVVPPSADEWARIPSWEWHRAGIEPGRSATVMRAVRVAPALERTLALGRGGSVVAARLQSIPGVGVWTAAETTQRSHGDPDSPSVGDFHVPALVGWALTGGPVDDDGMLELLEPWRGHRHRVVRLIGGSGLPQAGFRSAHDDPGPPGPLSAGRQAVARALAGQHGAVALAERRVPRSPARGAEQRVRQPLVAARLPCAAVAAARARATPSSSARNRSTSSSRLGSSSVPR